MARSTRQLEAPPGHERAAKTLIRPLVIALIGIAGWFAGTAAHAADSNQRTFQIEAQPVSAALKLFAAQSDLQMIFTESDVGGAKTGGVMGTKAVREALTELLKGTGLEFAFTTNQVVVVRRARGAGATTPENRDPPAKSTGDMLDRGKSESSTNPSEAQPDQGH